MMKYLTLVFIGLSVQLTLANIDKNLQNLNLAEISGLPGNITSKIPTETDLQDALMKKCEKVEDGEAGSRVAAAKNKTVECIKGLVDFDELQKEMDKAKPTGDLDSVFKKYCKKTPEFKECILSFTDALKPCLDEEEKKGLTTVMNVTEQLTEFVCYKEGDRIALFIAEGGPECLESSKDAINECVELVFKKYFPNTNEISVNDIPLLLFKAEQCQDFHKFQTCVVKKLEKCKEPTPANIIDSMFTFIKKATPCASYKFVDKTAEIESKSGASSRLEFLPVTSAAAAVLSLSLYRYAGGWF